MDFAINKSTDKIISAFEIYKNGSYQNLTKGEWIMPEDSVDNYEELNEKDKQVHYVKEKEYRNKWGTYVWCSSCFSKYPGSKAETINESEEHKMLKNWLFTKLKKDDLLMVYSKGSKKHKFENYVKLSELGIDWNEYSIEVLTKGYKSLRADIFLQFKEKHEFLGKGIFIEIQLSKQSKKETFDRSFSRAIHGYSTIWLFRDSFSIEEKDIQLKENKIKIFSFSSELKYSGKKFVQNLKISVEEECRYIDERMNNSKKELNNYLKQIYELVEKKKEEIQSLQKRVIDCPICKGDMIFKVTKIKQKELYECLSCKHTIWVK